MPAIAPPLSSSRNEVAALAVATLAAILATHPLQAAAQSPAPPVGGQRAISAPGTLPDIPWLDDQPPVPVEVGNKPLRTIFDDDVIAIPPGDHRYRFELKRQNTNVRSDAASSKTIARIEHFPKGELSLVRLEVPFPDERDGMPADTFNPHLGDVLFRLDWKGPVMSYWHLSPFVELTFPTANPQSLGTGKYQVAPGFHTDVPLLQARPGSIVDVWSWGALVQQVMSVAGDPNTAKISYLKFELALLQGWQDKYTLTTTLKPTIDWLRHNQTGGVIEVEGGVRLGDRWKLSLLVGAGLWGVGIPNTYNERTELTLGYEF